MRLAACAIGNDTCLGPGVTTWRRAYMVVIFLSIFFTPPPHKSCFSCILHYCCMAMRTGTHTPLPHDVICGRAPTYFSRGYPFSHEELNGLDSMPAPCLEALLICLPLLEPCYKHHKSEQASNNTHDDLMGSMQLDLFQYGYIRYANISRHFNLISIGISTSIKTSWTSFATQVIFKIE